MGVSDAQQKSYQQLKSYIEVIPPVLCYCSVVEFYWSHTQSCVQDIESKLFVKCQIYCLGALLPENDITCLKPDLSFLKALNWLL